MRWILFSFMALFVASCDRSAPAEQSPVQEAVFENRLLSASSDHDNWLTHGRTYDEQRYSPLTKITSENVSDLQLGWYADLDTHRGQEATPLVIDGKIFITTAWSMVKAYDAITGELLWEFDPEVSGDVAVKGCCDVVNRGLAAWEDKLFLGAFDGRLIALNRETGDVIWETVTVDQNQPYTITGAPRVIKGLVIIGNGGADFGVRGFVAAYSVETGEQVWKFYTVPDNPANGEQPDYLNAALETWNGEFWRFGGGGTVWDSMAYDPELDLLYIGIGNGSPWNQAVRSPGGGDNLYLSSIVAVRPSTGEYVWHFQTTPGETWDYTATQHIILADLMIEGELRKVLMQAPKNGFFYVLDRQTGAFISGNNYVPVNWATGLDAQGRPIENPDARYDKSGQPFLVLPGAPGGHSWQPMAFDAKRKIVFIPALNLPMPYFPEGEDYRPNRERGFNSGTDLSKGALPPIKEVRDQVVADTFGQLIAWDPISQTPLWKVDHPGIWNGGVLSTAGDIVFQGNSMGEFNAYHSATGDRLWSFPAQTGIVAAPITYEIDGEQYVAIVAGWGGAMALIAPILNQDAGPIRNVSRLLVFKINGNASLPDLPELTDLPISPPPFKGSEESVSRGAYLYGRYCGACHGESAIGGTVLPDLRRSAALEYSQTWKSIVSDGTLSDNGMVGFSMVMDEDEIEDLRHYVIFRAHEDRLLEE